MSESRERIFERRPIALQVRLAIDDVGTFVDRYAVNISAGGIFIRSREPRPVGTKLKFLLNLRNGEVVFAGEGTVRWVRMPEAGGVGLSGMGLQFDTLTEESRLLLEEIVRAREESLAPPPVEGASPETWPPLDAPPPAHDTPFPPRVHPPEEKQERPAKESRAGFTLGLDFGWANVRAAVASQQQAEPVALTRSGPLPVAFACVEGKLLVGGAALAAMREGVPGIRGLAQLLGRWPGASATASWRRRQLAEPLAGEDGRLAVSFGGRRWPVSALLEALLREVKSRAETVLGGEISRIVCAVPTAWTDPQRHALRQAADHCALPIDQIVSAPLAALLSLRGVGGARRTLAISFGAGAIESALVAQHEHVFELVASSSDAELGGADLDMALVASLLSQLEQETGLLVPEDGAIFERTRAAAEEAKCALSESLDFDLEVRGVVPAGLSRADLHQCVTRARLLAVTAALLDRAVEICRTPLTLEVDDIVLLGSQTQLAPFVRRLAARLGREPNRPRNADDAAACGAALVAADTDRLGSYLLAGVVGASVGFAGPGRPFRRIIERHLPLPIARESIVSPAPGEQEIELHVYQGESAEAAQNEYVGRVAIGPLRAEARIALSFMLDSGGELTMRARDLSTGAEVPATLYRDRPPPG